MAYETAPEPADDVKVLLYKIARGIWGIFTGTGTSIPVAPGGGVARSLASSAVTTSGTVAAGAKSVAFQTSSDWSGSVNGAARGVSQTFFISVPNSADTLPAIAYVRSAGTLYIDVLT